MVFFVWKLCCDMIKRGDGYDDANGRQGFSRRRFSKQDWTALRLGEGSKQVTGILETTMSHILKEWKVCISVIWHLWCQRSSIRLVWVRHELPCPPSNISKLIPKSHPSLLPVSSFEWSLLYTSAGDRNHGVFDVVLAPFWLQLSPLSCYVWLRDRTSEWIAREKRYLFSLSFDRGRPGGRSWFRGISFQCLFSLAERRWCKRASRRSRR